MVWKSFQAFKDFNENTRRVIYYSGMQRINQERREFIMGGILIAVFILGIGIQSAFDFNRKGDFLASFASREARASGEIPAHTFSSPQRCEMLHTRLENLFADDNALEDGGSVTDACEGVTSDHRANQPDLHDLCLQYRESCEN